MIDNKTTYTRPIKIISREEAVLPFVRYRLMTLPDEIAMMNDDKILISSRRVLHLLDFIAAVGEYIGVDPTDDVVYEVARRAGYL